MFKKFLEKRERGSLFSLFHSCTLHLKKKKKNSTRPRLPNFCLSVSKSCPILIFLSLKLLFGVKKTVRSESCISRFINLLNCRHGLTQGVGWWGYNPLRKSRKIIE